MEKINSKLKYLLDNKEYDELFNFIEILKKNKYPESISNFYLNKIPKNLNQIELSKEDINYNQESKFNLDINNKLGCISQIPFISIIIVTYNSGNDLYELLPTLKEQTYTNWEIIIVDNGEDKTKEICSKFLNKFKYVKCDNVGFAEGNNIGLENSSGELILLLNPDTKLDKNAIKNLVFNLRLDASAAAASPIIYFYDQFQKINLRSEGENFKANFSSLIEKIPYYELRYSVRPGLSGWAQVNYPYGASIKDSMNKLSYDLFYIKNYSIWLDILIFFKTIKLIFNGKGATPKNG